MWACGRFTVAGGDGACSRTVAAGLVNSGGLSGEQTRSVDGERIDDFQDLTDLIMVPGRFGLHVPLELLLRTLGHDGYVDFISLLEGVDIVKWFEDSAGNIELGPRGALESLLKQATDAMDGLRACLRAIERDESRDAILDAWIFRVHRYHPPAAFDRVVAEVAGDIGKEHLDVPRFRRRFYDQWMEKLAVLTGEYSFDVEARRLVDAALLADASAGMPITGSDIIGELGIPPGPAVGAALGLARQLYDVEPLSRDALLARLGETLATRSDMGGVG